MRYLKVLLLLFLVLLTPFLFTTKVYAAAPTVNRLSGADRYDTNINIIKNGWTEAPNVVIASGENYPDALCAAPLAEAKNAPILLTNGIQLSNSAVEELSRLKTKDAYIVGGTGVIAAAVETQLNSLGITCTRLAGQNRYETSVKVAEQLGTENGIAVASGENFPDALSIAPIAAEKGMPILLSLKTSLPDEVSSYLKDKNISVSYIIGGVGVLNTDVKNSLKNPKRLGGMTRYETNISVIREFQDSLDSDSIYAASGQNFPDALSGSVLAGNSNSPIVLMDNSLSEVTSDYLKEQNCKTMNILGGTGAVSSDAENTVKNTMKFLNIVKVDNISDTAFIGENYHFPDTALVTYEDSSTKLVPVKWDADSVDTSKAGQYAFDGTVQGYSGKAHMDLNVTEEMGNLNGNLANGGYFAYYKDNLYYCDIKDNFKIYKVGNDGSKAIKLNDDSSSCLNIAGNYIYYSSISDDAGIYRINLDGSGRTKIADNHATAFFVVGDWIYYSYKDQGTSAIYKMKTDGTGKVKLSDDYTYYFEIADDYIYYTNEADGRSIYRMKTDGTERTKLCSDSTLSPHTADGWIYYLATDGTSSGPDGPDYKLYKIKEDGTGKTKISDDAAASMIVYDEWIYYVNRSDNDKLYKIRKDGSDKTMLVDSRTSNINIIGEWIFYNALDYNSAYFTVKLDGSSNQRFGVTYRNESEPNNTLSSANALNPEQGFGDAKPIIGELDKDDVDYFLFVPSNTFYHYLDVVLSAPNMEENAVITLTDVNGNPLYSVKTGYDGMAAFSIDITSHETCYLKISSENGDLIEDGKYSLLTWYQAE